MTCMAVIPQPPVLHRATWRLLGAGTHLPAYLSRFKTHDPDAGVSPQKVPWPRSAPRIIGRARATMWPRTLGRATLRAYRSPWRPLRYAPMSRGSAGRGAENAKRFRAPLLECTDND